MQMVINIPEEVYQNILHTGKANFCAVNAIEAGTILPKGHGDLIDRKELLKQPMDKANYPSNYVRIAPIIIEADKTESEE